MSQQKSSIKNVVKITCVQCNTEFFGSFNSKLCSPECKHQHKKDYENNARLKSSLLKFPESADPNTYVECKLCGLRAADIGSHIRIHKISTKDYTQLYGGIKCKNFVDAMTGDKNPAYQHGGKLSPFSKNFINYKGDEYIENLKEQAVQTKEENRNNPCTVEYYIKRGMSEDKAIDALRERQTTFSLEICMEKYGVEEGTKIWQDRQDKWQHILNSKSQEEIDKINSLKSTKINFKTLWGKDLTEPGNFYIIKLCDNKYKIGITSKNSIYARYNKRHLNGHVVLLFEMVDSIKHAFQIEQLLKCEYQQTIEKVDYGVFGWTEIITENNQELLLDKFKTLSDKNYANNKFKITFNK